MKKKIFKFKVDNKNTYLPNEFCLGSISEKFDIAQSGEVSFKGSMSDFSVNCNGIDKSDILNIQKYLIVKRKYKTMFRLIKQVFLALLRFSGSLATKCIYLNNQPSMARPALTDLNPDEHNQGLYHYLFKVNLGGSNGSCNTLDELSTKIYVPNKTKDVNSNAFDKITRINESKTLTNVIKIKSGIILNNDVSAKIR